MLAGALEEAQRTHETKMDECFQTEREKSRAAIEEALNEERKSSTELLEELKVSLYSLMCELTYIHTHTHTHTHTQKSHTDAMEAEREKAKEEMAAAVDQERQRSKVRQFVCTRLSVYRHVRVCHSLSTK